MASTQNGMNTEKNYVLGRDVAATVRLHVQHHYAGKTLGFQLDPAILDQFAHKDKDDKLAIADAGAGTGIWACEVATLLGDRCTVDGYDISDSQFPHTSCLPANVHLTGQVDLLGELDPGICDRYDIIHTRFWVCVIRHDISPLIRNLYRMCKPGGWVQYTDAYMAEHWVIYPDDIAPESTAQGTQGVLDGFRSFLQITGSEGTTFAWQEGLEEVFKDAGFVNYELTVHRAPEPYASYNSDQLLVLGGELAKGALAMGATKGADVDAAKRLLLASEAGKAESMRGIHMNWTLLSIKAQRPLGP